MFLIIAIFRLNISQGSVATLLRCSGILKNDSIANLPIKLSEQKLKNLKNGHHLTKLRTKVWCSVFFTQSVDGIGGNAARQGGDQ